MSTKNRQETFKNPTQNFSFLQPRSTNRALKDIGNRIYDNEPKEKDAASDLGKSNITDNTGMAQDFLKRNQSKETTKKKYELMLSDYLNNDEKRVVVKDLPRDRVESKIKRFKEFINRDESSKAPSKTTLQTNQLTLKSRPYEEKENEFDKYAFSSHHVKSRFNKEQTYSPDNHEDEERV